METNRWERVKSLFHEALLLSPEQREEFVESRASGDIDLLAEVRELLSAHEAESAAVTARGGDAPVGGPGSAGFGVDAPGAVIDRYRILEEIGEGGFGSVFLAEQIAPIQRRVAFKILKPGMDTKRVLARFEAEQQALARMDHPNIAKMIDAGSTVTGRPYFVMELIRGVHITEYCDRANLDTRARLELMTDVCRAIQHAHQKGIIHRDIKPSNVLVTLQDGIAVPKVIDFGIAKATGQRLTEKTLFTAAREMLGTPEYMAPEQAEMSGLDVDTRADIYSLGVLLYEILTGTKPFDLKDALRSGFSALLEHIRDVEPQKPSTRVGTLGARAVEVAKRRATDVRQLSSALRGDLDWIVMKAIAKDRTRRYETAVGLALDIERFLASEPVLAGPPTLRYRFGKFVRKHRGFVLAGAAVVGALVVGLIVALWQFGIARVNERAAKASAQVAEENLELAHAREAEATASLARAREAERRASDLLAAEASARREATAQRLAAQAIAIAQDDPATALHLAIEGAQLHRDDESNIALYTAIDEHRTLARLSGHDAVSEHLAVSRNGRYAISSDPTMLVIVWDLVARRILHRIDVHEGSVHALGFTSDDERAFTASADGTVRLWRIADGTSAGVLEHPEGVEFAAMLGRSDRLITLCADGALREWELRELVMRRVVHRFERPARAVALAADGDRFGVLDDAMDVHVVDLAETVATRRIHLAKDSPPPYYNVETWYLPSIEFSVDGRLVLTRNRAGHVALWDASTGARIRELAGAGRFCGPVALSPDARRVFLLRRDLPGKVVIGEIVDVESGAVTCTLLEPGELEERARAWFSPDGYTLVTIVGGRGAFWNTGSGVMVGRMRSDPHGLYSPCFVMGDEAVLTGSQEGPLYLFARSAYREWRGLAASPGGNHTVTVMTASPDGTRAVVRGAPLEPVSPVRLVDTSDGRMIATLLERGAPNSDAWFSPDARFVAATGGREREVVVVEVATGAVRFRRRLRALAPRLSQDGRFLVLRVADQFRVWDLEREAEIGVIPTSTPMPANVTADGARLVVPDGGSGTVSIWDIATQTRVGVAEHVAFAFDGVLTIDRRFLVSIANDSSGQIRDAQSLRRLASLDMPTTDLARLSLSPDGSMAAISTLSELLVFEVPSGRRIARWKSPQRYETCAFRPDGRALIVRSGDRLIYEIPLDALGYATSRRSGLLSATLMDRYGLGSAEDRVRRRSEQLADIVSAAALIRTASVMVSSGAASPALELLARARSLRRRVPASCDYVEACARAQRLGNPAERDVELRLGLDALRRFAASGKADRAVLEAAPLLAPLRAQPEFGVILESVR
jgi:serine/threonine protein kinase/WD40 repeat protein